MTEACQETGQVLFQLQGFIDKLVQQLPVVDVPIILKKKNTASVPLGHTDNLLPGRRCVFINAGESDRKYAEPLTWNGKWIQGVVESVKDDESILKIYPATAAKMINPGDRAILR